jgi:conjugative transfer signal peptidase TraF
MNAEPSIGHRSERPLRGSRVGRNLLGACVLLCVTTAGLSAATSRFTINLTPSLPRGVYWLRPRIPPARGSAVSLPVPESFRVLVSERRYVPPTFHLLKHVVGSAGDRVCTDGGKLVVNDVFVSEIATKDLAGRPLPPPYPFCGVLPADVFFVGGDGPSSLDSRYFGPVPRQDLTTALPLWTSF